MYTITTAISPMDDSDLTHNFKKFRRLYYIKQGLWIPEDTICKFAEIEDPSDGKRGPILATMLGAANKIIVIPDLSHIYCAAKTALLHEMAHLYIGVSTNWDNRFQGHGKTFNTEIDRLYVLGAFRKLI